MAEADSSTSGTPVSMALPNPGKHDGDLAWVKKLSEADQVVYYQGRLAWQQARAKFADAKETAAMAKQQPVDTFDGLKAKYDAADTAKKAAKAESEKLKGEIEKAQKALDAADPDDSAKTNEAIAALQTATQDYVKQAAEFAKAKTALDQAQEALSAAGGKQAKFDRSTIKLADDTEAAADQEYQKNVALAGAEMDSAMAKFDDLRVRLQTGKAEDETPEKAEDKPPA